MNTLSLLFIGSLGAPRDYNNSTRGAPALRR